jgi:Xaa-Pro aminopeptidase
LGLSEDVDGPLLDALVALRLSHDATAEHELRRAARISVEAHRVGMRETRAGKLESDIVAAMEAVFRRASFATAYGSIVTVRGEILHNHEHGGQLRSGELLLADVGGETDTGYAADITRTWPVSGRFSTTQRELYEVVLSAQRAAIALARPGVRYRDVHLAAARALTEGLVALGILRGEVPELVARGAHALFMPHGIGHLLGLDVHDMEDLGDRAGYTPGLLRDAQFGLSYLRLDRVLAPGMAVTIEPGFYQVPFLLAAPERVGLDGSPIDRARLAQFADVRGIRIEDDVLITEQGNEVLTATLAKEPDAVEEAMLAG